MILHLNNLLRHLFINQVRNITSEEHVRFQPPDQEWRTVVSNLDASLALNVYLFEMRENRKLRTNERTREIQDGIATDTPAPRRVDCHYLITAWSPATVTAAVEPTLDEHELLFEVTRTLMNTSLIPSELYPPNSKPLLSWPENFREMELPATVLPVDGFPKYAEFWGTMGNVHPWKPAVYLVVTLPVALRKERDWPLVTTRITEYRQFGKPETAEVWVQIGGTVLDAGDATKPPKPVAHAWVRLETETGNPATEGQPLKTTKTNELGRFTFGELVPGRYRLRVHAPELGEKIKQNVDVPSPTGEYDIRFP